MTVHSFNHGSHDTNGNINETIAFLKTIKLRHNMTFGYVIPLALASHNTMALLMTHCTHVSTSTSTGTKGHITSVNNNLKIKYAMVSLITPSASHYCHEHAINSYAIYKPHIPISSCVHMTHLCQYICLI